MEKFKQNQLNKSQMIAIMGARTKTFINGLNTPDGCFNMKIVDDNQGNIIKIKTPPG